MKLLTSDPQKMTQFVVPDEGSLEIESYGCVCAVEGCGREFQSSSQLRMHQLKHHQGKELSPRSGNTKYFCPVEGCERSKESGKPFPRLGQLKQVNSSYSSAVLLYVRSLVWVPSTVETSNTNILSPHLSMESPL